MKIAINGFGRIGRTTLKTIISPHDWGRIRLNKKFKRDAIEVVAINNLGGLDETSAYLFKHDSVYGTYPDQVQLVKNGTHLRVGSREIPFYAEADPSNLPWGELDIDIVLECTGAFTEFSKAEAHIKAGAKRVIISANGKGAGTSIVIGTDSYKDWKEQKEKPQVIANCSCTTNCAGPLMQLLHSHYQILKAQLITVHAITSTQSLLDNKMKDLRGSRSAFASIIPQSTGAAKAVERIIPDLKGKVSGSAFRVPVINGSVLEVVAQVSKETTAEEINNMLINESENEYLGIIECYPDGLVSSDIIGLPISTIIDLPLTEVLDLPNVKDENLVKVVAWYDNEYAYTCRLVELAQKVGETF
ncbi:type I glyceraldehyde-3-phosphate dehydrogenase [Patescibacteria group bacterium]|nr:type I glyceraldehyde-3-phosphate dehydrogenase [Patescibacteria group bacterium]